MHHSYSNLRGICCNLKPNGICQNISKPNDICQNINLFFSFLIVKVGPLAAHYQVPLRHILLVCIITLYNIVKKLECVYNIEYLEHIDLTFLRFKHVDL